ncbi:MAG: hypothetical protein J6S92_04030, partial [Oscillospiraceae bacterium]|nr:hypothetical protein [Oscillospiraceae bacterium]
IGGIFFHFAGLCLIFLVIGVAAAVIAIRNTIIVCSNKSKGKVVKGTVYGYMDDTISYNNVNGQQVKLLIDTQDGKRFLLIPLATTEKPYPVNSTVNVRVYRNTAYILDDIPNL